MLISFAVTAKLICVFVFAYAKRWFSHDAAHLFYNFDLHDQYNDTNDHLSHVTRNPALRVSGQGCTTTKDGQRLAIADLGSRRIVLYL